MSNFIEVEVPSKLPVLPISRLTPGIVAAFVSAKAV
jgi:hypothetical protein